MKTKKITKAAQAAFLRETVAVLVEEFKSIKTFNYPEDIGWNLFRMDCHIGFLEHFVKESLTPKPASTDNG